MLPSFEATSAEGWVLSNDSQGRCEIQKFDEDPQDRFPSDDEARAFVLQRAAEGSPAHLLVVTMEGLPHPDYTV